MESRCKMYKIVISVHWIQYTPANVCTSHQSVTFWFRNFSVSKLFHFFDGIGFGFEKFWYRKKYRIRFRFFWYRKKYRIRFRNFLVSKKVSDLVSIFFGFEKSIGLGFETFWYRKKDQIKSLGNLPELRRFCELIELCELTWVTLSCPSWKKY